MKTRQVQKHPETRIRNLNVLFILLNMQLTLTKTMQQSVKLALKQPGFLKRHVEEAEKIAELDMNETKVYPITVELIHHVSSCLG